jgi:DNA-binding response OmpR family regulator
MKEKILVVDDDPQIRDIYRRILETNGYLVTLIEDGDKVFPALSVERPDLIILDLMLPGLNGLDILKRVKEDPKFAELKIIILSALSDETSRESAGKFGAFKYFVKSETSTADVMQTVEKALLERIRQSDIGEA